MFRQWHQRFVAALGQVEGALEEIVQQLVKETDLGKELDKVVDNLKITYLYDHPVGDKEVG